MISYGPPKNAAIQVRLIWGGSRPGAAKLPKIVLFLRNRAKGMDSDRDMFMKSSNPVTVVFSRRGAKGTDWL